jgi:hypothetical protein
MFDVKSSSITAIVEKTKKERRSSIYRLLLITGTRKAKTFELSALSKM